MKGTFKSTIIAALKRAAWTAAEVAIPMIPVGASVEEINWIHVISVVAVAALISLLKSVLLSMPEVELEEQVKAQAAVIATQQIETDITESSLETSEEDLEVDSPDGIG